MYDLLKEDYKKEENIIHNIMHNSSFPIHPRKPPTHKTRKHLDTTQAPPQKWATFPYTGKEITFITNIFKWTNLKIAFHTNNSIGDRLMHKQQITDSYTWSGVYRLKCPDCNKAYVGQTTGAFWYGLMNTKVYFGPTAILPNLPNTLSNTTTPLAPFTIQCKC